MTSSSKKTQDERDKQSRGTPERAKKNQPKRKRRQGRATHYQPFTPEQLARRVTALPVISYPDLPVTRHRDEIAQAIRDNQVIIISGETGSGKTTQIPKICLQLGRGISGMIGHTQPRRIAAHSVAARIAEELGQTVSSSDGAVIGYQVRFTDKVGPTTLVKLMTDGILLNEIQSDPLLRMYDTLIIDEAHERSLNIDFILGYITRLLPLRPDLKVIITSATIDSDRFARHFGKWKGQPGKGTLISPAPVIEVSGRTYPVEIRYRPLSEDSPTQYTSSSAQLEGARKGTHTSTATHASKRTESTGASAAGTENPENSLHTRQLVLEDPKNELATLGYGLGDEIDTESAICLAVEELCDEGDGDILIFLPGERDIHDTEQALIDHLGPKAFSPPATSKRSDAVEVLPLYARLSAAEQQRIFREHNHRRIILATNVAETSLTVPGVHYVIDSGLARISRFSNRTKVQRLPIEKISQASANQRAGRAGRIADGIAIRLYSHDDFESRPEFTEPEILRTSLASVILQMAALGLGAIGDFPFVDPPDSRAVRDGIAALVEIGALIPEDGPSTVPNNIQHGHESSNSRKNTAVSGGGGSGHRLTQVGRDLARLPIDPKLGRMLIEGQKNGCASEILIIVAALSIQDVRERPVDKREEADAAHARFLDSHSDFITYLNLWRYLNIQSRDLSASAFRRMCRREFLHYLRYREWRDVVTQLRQMAKPLGLDVHNLGIPSKAEIHEMSIGAPPGQEAVHAAVTFTTSTHSVDPNQIHRSLLVGLLSHLGNWDEAKRDYAGARGTHFTVWPGSGLSGTHPAWVMAAELVETSRLFARTAARIRSEWIEPAAAHLVKRVYSEPYWSSAKGAAMIHEKVLLYGMTLLAERPVLLGSINIDGKSSGKIRSTVARAGTLMGLAQGLRGGSRSDTVASSAVVDALSEALEAFNTTVSWDENTDTDDSAPSRSALAQEIEPIEKPRSTATAQENTITSRELAREMFIRHALVNDEWREHHIFIKENKTLLDQAREVERRSREYGLVAGEEARFAFFDDLIPANIISARHFNRWWKNQRRTTPDLLTFTQELLIPRGVGSDPTMFPNEWVQGDLHLPLSYEFTPGSPRDGVTMDIPLELLPRISEDGTEWLVPGMREELLTGIIRALPKAKRRLLAPAPEVASQVSAWIDQQYFSDESAPTARKCTTEKAVQSAKDAGPGLEEKQLHDKKSRESGAPDPTSMDAALSRLTEWGQRGGNLRIRNSPESPRKETRESPTEQRPQDTPVPQADSPSNASSFRAASVSAQPPPLEEVFIRAISHMRGVELTASDFAHAREELPPHLLMTFVVRAKNGKELGSSTSLLYLQRTLARQANRAVRSAVRGAVADAFARAAYNKKKKNTLAGDNGEETSAPVVGMRPGSEPQKNTVPTSMASASTDPAIAQLHADGLIDFPSTALPRSIETTNSRGMSLRAFPAFVAQGSPSDPKAGIRVMAEPAEADTSHWHGLTNLLVRKIRLSETRVITRWSGRQTLMLAASPYPSTTQLIADAQLASALSLVDELSEPGGPSSIRSADAFGLLTLHARDLHEDRVYEILGYVVQAMDAFSEVEATLEKYTHPSLSAIARNVRESVKTLVFNGFVSATPLAILPNVARYLRAQAQRLPRASQSPRALADDQRNCDTIHEVTDAVERAFDDLESRRASLSERSAVEQAKWLVHELEVSLFAQSLGTPTKVSAQRILRMITP